MRMQKDKIMYSFVYLKKMLNHVVSIKLNKILKKLRNMQLDKNHCTLQSRKSDLKYQKMLFVNRLCSVTILLYFILVNLCFNVLL